MKRNTIKKIVLAIAFTLALTFGLGIVGEQIGLSTAPTVYACGSANGGGC